MFELRIGEKIPVHACKTDGTVYRHWTAEIESADDELLVTIAPAGSAVFNINGENYPLRHHYRAYYWRDKFHNLLEIFETDGRLMQVYINIASPPTFEHGVLSFKDHELDVSKVLPHPAKIVYEDEFAEAVLKYNYSRAFQETMRAAAQEALKLAENWQAKPCPIFGENHA